MDETNDTISESTAAETPKPSRKHLRGFASMTPEKVREIASKGGKAAQATGRTHRFTAETARQAGLKGGSAPHKSRGPKPQGRISDEAPSIPPTE